MKKVNFKDKNTIDMYDLTDNHYIGIEFDDGIKGFIEKISDENTTYIISSLTLNSKLYAECELIKKRNIQQLINHIVNVKNIYVFNTERELGQWLIKDL